MASLLRPLSLHHLDGDRLDRLKLEFLRPLSRGQFNVASPKEARVTLDGWPPPNRAIGERKIEKDGERGNIETKIDR